VLFSWRKRREQKERARVLLENRKRLREIAAKAREFDRGIKKCGGRTVVTEVGYERFTSIPVVEDGAGIEVTEEQDDDTYRLFVELWVSKSGRVPPKVKLEVDSEPEPDPEPDPDQFLIPEPQPKTVMKPGLIKTDNEIAEELQRDFERLQNS